MRIAVCDDDRQELLQIAALLEEYKTSAPEELFQGMFLGGLELLSALRDGCTAR